MSVGSPWMDPNQVPPPHGVTVEIFSLGSGEPIFAWWDADAQFWRSYHSGMLVILMPFEVVGWREAV